MSVETMSSKKKGVKKGWKKIKKLLLEDEAMRSTSETSSVDDDELFSSEELRWSVTEDGATPTPFPATQKIENIRNPSCLEEDVYLSDAEAVYDTSGQKNPAAKTKKTKKKKLKAGSTEKPSSLKSGSSTKRSKTKSSSKKDKTKKKKKKSRNPSMDADSCSDDSILKDEEVETYSSARTEETGDSTTADDQPETSMSSTMNEHNDGNQKIRPPRSSDRVNILKNKIQASLTSFGELNATSALMQEFGSIRLSDSQRHSHTPFEQAYSRDRESSMIERMSVQNKNMMENLLNELHQYELQLEEERREMSKERSMMQLKQKSVEQMLEMEMNKVSQLESQILVLQERLGHSAKAKEDNELLQKIKVLETQNELLREKTERQGQRIGRLSMVANQSDEFRRDDRSSLSMPKLPGKEQGELLMLRSAFEEQAKELAKTKEQLRSSKEHQRVQELEQTVANADQQTKFFMEEIVRLKKLLANTKASPQKPSKPGKEAPSSSSWWAIA